MLTKKKHKNARFLWAFETHFSLNQTPYCFGQQRQQRLTIQKSCHKGPEGRVSIPQCGASSRRPLLDNLSPQQWESCTAIGPHFKQPGQRSSRSARAARARKHSVSLCPVPIKQPRFCGRKAKWSRSRPRRAGVTTVPVKQQQTQKEKKSLVFDRLVCQDQGTLHVMTTAHGDVSSRVLIPKSESAPLCDEDYNNKQKLTVAATKECMVIVMVNLTFARDLMNRILTLNLVANCWSEQLFSYIMNIFFVTNKYGKHKSNKRMIRCMLIHG